MRTIILTLILCISFGAQAKKKTHLKPEDRGYRVLIIPAEMDQIKSEMNQEYSVLMPKNVSQGDSGDRVASKIGDQVIQKWLDSDAGAGVARGVKTVENSMRAEVSVGNKKKAGTEHKFGFNVKAVEATTELKYTGWFNSVLKYDARDRQTTFEVTEKILSGKDLFMNHTANNTEDHSTVGLRWNW